MSTSNEPLIPGIKNFCNKVIHSSSWPEELKLHDKNIGIIGTGSTGIQIIPEIADKAKSLIVFQRTANYSIPAKNHKIYKETRENHKLNFELLKAIAIENRHGHPWPHSLTEASSVSKKIRTQILDKAWRKGGLSFRDCFSDINNNNFANLAVTKFIREKIEKTVKNKSKAKILSNFNHPFGAKRPALDIKYFETFNKENVKLIDLKKHKIRTADKYGIWVDQEYHPMDILIFATGFDAITGSILKIKVIGRKKVNLKNEWSKNIFSLLGLQIPGFPNLFTITGPGSPSVLTNMPRAIEQHVDWITNCIKYLRENGKNYIEANKKAAIAWDKEVKKAAEKGMFLKTSNSWYLGTNIKGKPSGFIPYSGGLNHYRKICNDIAYNDYRGFSLR